MKKLLFPVRFMILALTVCLSLLSAPAHSGTPSSVLKFDTVIVYANSDSTIRYTYSYDTDARVSQISRNVRNNGVWLNAYRDNYTYDQAGNCTIYLVEAWDTGQWVNSWRSLETYDTFGHLTENLWQNWDSTGWVNTWRETDAYDNNGNLLQSETDMYTGSGWTGRWRDTYTYNTHNDVLTYLWEDYTGSTWTNHLLETFGYDASYQNIQMIVQDWVSGAWVNDARYSYTYDQEGKMLTKNLDYWVSGAWSSSNRHTMTYDANGNVQLNLGEGYTSGNWVPFEKFTNSYDANGKAITGDYFTWSGTDWLQTLDAYIQMGFDSDKTAFSFYGYHVDAHYISLQGIPNAGAPEPVYLTCTPNPVSSSATVDFSLVRDASVSLQLFGMNGSHIRDLLSGNLNKGEHTLQVNCEDLQTGIYFVTLHAGATTRTIRMVVSR